MQLEIEGILSLFQLCDQNSEHCLYKSGIYLQGAKYVKCKSMYENVSFDWRYCPISNSVCILDAIRPLI